MSDIYRTKPIAPTKLPAGTKLRLCGKCGGRGFVEDNSVVHSWLSEAQANTRLDSCKRCKGSGIDPLRGVP